MDWRRHSFVYEINTWPWLTELDDGHSAPIGLAEVPGYHWDAIADAGFDAVWLMGVWQRSPAGAAVALADPDLVESFRSALPDWTPQDVVGSPYCVRDYVVDPRLGGRRGLAAARAALADRGVGLVLDFVPNHVAPDHPWTSTHPEYFIRGDEADLGAEPGSFSAFAGAVWANGRDPYFPAWRDVLQLNAFSEPLRAAVVGIVRDIADQCDGIRCDMAMLVTNDVFARTWGDRAGVVPSTDYWPEVIGAVRDTHPDFGFLAEAYWGTEEALLRQGFDSSYDKRWYDAILARDNAGLESLLIEAPEVRGRRIRFVENHDEPRVAAVLAPAQLKSAMVATMTQPGARLVHHGQFEGRRTRLPVFLGRSPREEVDDELRAFHAELFDVLQDSTFRSGTWSRCEVVQTHPGSTENLLGWCWEGDRRWLVAVNVGGTSVAGHVVAPWQTGDGVRIELEPWGWRLFLVESGDPIGLICRLGSREA